MSWRSEIFTTLLYPYILESFVNVDILGSPSRRQQRTYHIKGIHPNPKPFVGLFKRRFIRHRKEWDMV